MLFHIFVQNIYSSKSQIQQFTRLICQRLYKKTTTFHQAETKSADEASIKCQQKQTHNRKNSKKRNMQDDRIDRPACFDMLDIFLYYFVQFHTALHVLFSKTMCVCYIPTDAGLQVRQGEHAWLASWQDGAFRTKSGKEIKCCSKYPAPLPTPRHVLFHNLYRFRHNL